MIGGAEFRSPASPGAPSGSFLDKLILRGVPAGHGWCVPSAVNGQAEVTGPPARAAAKEGTARRSATSTPTAITSPGPIPTPTSDAGGASRRGVDGTGEDQIVADRSSITCDQASTLWIASGTGHFSVFVAPWLQ